MRHNNTTLNDVRNSGESGMGRMQFDSELNPKQQQPIKRDFQPHKGVVLCENEVQLKIREKRRMSNCSKDKHRIPCFKGLKASVLKLLWKLEDIQVSCTLVWLIYLTSCWFGCWPKIYVTIYFLALGDSSTCHKILWAIYFPPKFASVPLPFWVVVGELWWFQPRARFKVRFFPRLTQITPVWWCAQISWCSLGREGKVPLVRTLVGIGNELIMK